MQDNRNNRCPSDEGLNAALPMTGYIIVMPQIHNNFTCRRWRLSDSPSAAAASLAPELSPEIPSVARVVFFKAEDPQYLVQILEKEGTKEWEIMLLLFKIKAGLPPIRWHYARSPTAPTSSVLHSLARFAEHTLEDQEPHFLSKAFDRTL